MINQSIINKGVTGVTGVTKGSKGNYIKVLSSGLFVTVTKILAVTDVTGIVFLKVNESKVFGRFVTVVTVVTVNL